MKVSEAIERPARHWNEDGVAELTTGLQLCLTGAIFWFGHTLPHGSTFGKIYAFAATGLWMAVSFGGRWSLRRLKERLIAPRAGYVVPRQEEIQIHFSSKGVRIDRTSWLYIAVAAALVLFTLGILLLVLNRTTARGMWGNDPEKWNWMIGFSVAILMAVGVVWTAVYYKSPRYLWLAAMALGLGAWEFRRFADPMQDLIVMLTWMGGAMAVIGAIRLRTFLNSNPRVEQSGE